MEHRHFVSQPQMSDLGPDHMWNHQHPGLPMDLADGSSMLRSHAISSQNRIAPCDNAAMRMGDIPLPNYNSGSLNYASSGTKSSYSSYVCPPTSSSLNRLPPYHVQNGPCYNRVMVSDVTDMSNSQLDYGRATYKRKIPSVSDAGRGTLSGYYGAGSSSGFPFPSGHLEPKPVVGHGYWTVDPVSSGHSFQGNEQFSSEDTSQRNVRSRHHGHAIHHEMMPSANPSRYTPRQFPPVMNTVNPTVVGQWNHNSVALDPNPIVNSSDLGSFSYEMHHSNRGSYGPNIRMGTNGHNHPNTNVTRTMCYPLPDPREMTAQPSAVVPSSSSNHRTAHRTPLSYPAAGFPTRSHDFRMSTDVTAIPPRHSRNLSILAHDNVGSRARNQFQIFSNAGNAHARWSYEGAVMFDQSSLYNSMNYFDQHSDMRLDIDNLSYEELLALGERIGSVNTGLTEEAMSRCLLESTYCSFRMMQDDEDEENCAICLEPYEYSDRLGKLCCRHEFHSRCIKKWLSIKNSCPICKVSALEDAPKDKRAVSM